MKIAFKKIIKKIPIVQSIPLPYFSDLIGLIKHKAVNHTSWEIKGYLNNPQFCNGAESLLHICRQNPKNTNDICLLLPAYFCGQSLRYLRDAGIIFIFYNLHDDLTPNYRQISNILQTQKPDIFLHVHYFGKILKQRETRDLCENFNMTMVEDCAHIIHPSIHDNWMGDYIFFSPHKFFPVKNSSVVFSKNKMNIGIPYREEKFPISWYLKRILKRYISFNNQNNSWNVKWNSQSSSLEFFSPNLREIDLLESRSFNVFEMSKIRVRNKDLLFEALDLFKKWSPVSLFDEKDTPYILGMRCESEAAASKLFSRFISCKCPVMMWPDLPYELEKSAEFYGLDIDRVKETIFFFLHEQIDIGNYLKLIQRSLNEK
jgi:hypothetical protein